MAPLACQADTFTMCMPHFRWLDTSKYWTYTPALLLFRDLNAKKECKGEEAWML